ncbi:MAG TPA: DsbE family thiol:disulfide interchange protein [Xanthobacteraceae bacterium]
MLRLISLVPVMVFAAVSVGLGFSLSNDPRKLPSMLIDKPTPAFKLAALDGGGGLSSDDLKGKIALLNVFASWCAGCRVEHPMLMALAQRSGLPIYGVSWKDDRATGASWLKANQSPYVQVGDDASGRLGIDLGVTGVPETFVIDRTGRIRYRHAGPITDEAWQETFEPLLAALRSEPQ